MPTKSTKFVVLVQHGELSHVFRENNEDVLRTCWETVQIVGPFSNADAARDCVNRLTELRYGACMDLQMRFLIKPCATINEVRFTPG